MHTARAPQVPLRLIDLFPPEAIRVGMAPLSKTDVIEALVHHAVVLGHLRGQEERRTIDRILAREVLASTAVGHGLAMPHCPCEALDRTVGVAGLLDQAIPFDAADGQPVDGVFLTLSPVDGPGLPPNLLGRLVALGRDRSLHLLLHDCQTAEQVAAFLDDLDRPADGHLDDLARLSMTQFEDERSAWSDLDYFSLEWGAHDRDDAERPPWSFL